MIGAVTALLARFQPAPVEPPRPAIEHVATAGYFTHSEAGAILSAHVCVFGRLEGQPVSFVETTDSAAAGVHWFLLVGRADWAYHQALPEHARPIAAPRKPNLVILPGGGDAA